MTSWKNVHVIFALLVLTESEEITRLKKKKTIKIIVEVSRFYILQAGNQSNH